MFRQFVASYWFRPFRERHTELRLTFEAFLFAKYPRVSARPVRSGWLNELRQSATKGLGVYLLDLEIEVAEYINRVQVEWQLKRQSELEAAKVRRSKERQQEKLRRKRDAEKQRRLEKEAEQRGQMLGRVADYHRRLNHFDSWSSGAGSLEAFAKERAAERIHRQSRFKNSRGAWGYRK